MSGKKKGKIKKLWLILAIVSAVLMIIMFVADGVIFGMGLDTSLNSFLNVSSGSVSGTDPNAIYYASNFDSSYEESICTQVEEEGAVLLMNDNNTLPLASGTNVSLFSESSYNFVYNGTGSGAVVVPGNLKTINPMTLTESLTKAGLNVNSALASVYESNTDYQRVNAEATGGYSKDYQIKEMPVSVFQNDSSVTGTFSTYSTAIVTLSRSGGEGADLPYGSSDAAGAGTGDLKNGDYLILNDVETTMMQYIQNNSDITKIIVILNGSNTLQLDFLSSYDKIGAVLWVGDVGNTGMEAIGEILTGKVNPSGRIVDTFLNNNKTSPAMANFGVYEYSNAAALGLASAQNNNDSAKASEVAGSSTDADITKMNSRYVVYEEGIYVGYKYYETRYEDYVMGSGNADNDSWSYSSDVAYPFGYGLSYTDTSVSGANGEWTYSDFGVVQNETDASKLDVSVTVTNNTGVAGKHTVQIYLQSPYTTYDKDNGIEKASVALVGFDKKEIKAGESETYAISVDKSSLAAYDSNKAEGYILEDGTYYFTAAHDAHEAVNNILAAKIEDETLDDTSSAISSKMDATGNTDMVGTIEVASESDLATVDAEDTADVKIISSKDATLGVDVTTFKTADSVYGNGSEYDVTNQFDNADLTKAATKDYGMSATVKYLSRSDWKNTWPSSVTSFAVTEQMWEDGIANDSSSSVGPDGSTTGSAARAALVKAAEDTYKAYYKEQYGKDITDVPTMGASGSMNLFDVITVLKDDKGNYAGLSADFNDEKWSALLDQATYSEMTELIYNGFRVTKAIESIGLPSTDSSDGPVGITNAMSNASVHGMGYTSEDVMAATYNRDLIEKVGNCIGEDFLAKNTPGAYGPGANIHRTPYSGRNYEYYSEDGYLSGEIAAVEVKGMSDKGVMVMMKHFVLNDQENGRYGISVFANEQSIREVYLKCFAKAMGVGQGVGVMTSFNRIGVVWSGADFNLMTNVLRREFNTDGIAITDCSMFATPMDYRLGVLAGQNIWCGMKMGMDQLKGYDTDAVMVTAVRESVQRIAYTVGTSAGMNTLTADSSVSASTPWYGILLITLGVIFAVAMVACLVMLFLPFIKQKFGKNADPVDDASAGTDSSQE